MTGNLDIWNKHRTIPTDQAKPITGKEYSGTSPKPHYIIWCLTDMFGPLGKGFGWNVLADEFTLLGDTHLHWCRIRFWWRDSDGVHECEQYGQTKAAYTTSGGKHRVDEDAPKKSLTDAVVKAASQLGVAADIFLGRWDDSKYLAELKAEERAAKEPPPFDPQAAVGRIVSAIGKCKTRQQLTALWKREGDTTRLLKADHPSAFDALVAAFAKANDKSIHDPAMQAPEGTEE